ncbi:MAG: hypothetical protein R3C52_09855 [Hyphomonadaceae bacterium]
MLITHEDNVAFRKIADSLRMSRRMEIEGENDENVAALLYEDPFPDQHLHQEIARPRTAFIVGRKGTGKSTILQKVQSDLEGERRAITAYLDVKSINREADLSHVVFPNEQHRLFGRRIAWFQAFLRPLLEQITDQLERRSPQSNFISLMRGRNGRSEALQGVKSLVDVNRYIQDVDVSTNSMATVGSRTAQQDDRGYVGGVRITANGPAAEMGVRGGRLIETEQTVEHRERNIIRVFQFGRFVHELKSALHAVGVKYVYVFLDDYSEISKDDAASLMNEIIHPLDTATDELFKFKIAVYPNAYDLGLLEPSRIDVHYLDISSLHSRRNVPEMEASAIDYVRRLLVRRFEYFSRRKKIDSFFRAPMGDVYSLLFQASFCNPRTLGWVLYFAAEDGLADGQPLSLEAIRNGARKYYERILSVQISDRRMISAPREQRDKIIVANSLLDELVRDAKQLRKFKGTKYFSEIKRDNPTSHFYCSVKYDEFLVDLQEFQLLNFYKSIKNKDGKLVNLYALDFGLCEFFGILYGKPGRGSDDKDYWVQRVFDFDACVRNSYEGVQIFRCDKCSASRSAVDSERFREYDFLCPACKQGRLVKEVLSREDDVSSSTEEEVLSNDEFNLLTILRSVGADERIGAKKIASVIDISPQAVGKIAKRLAEAGHVERVKAGSVYTYAITESANRRFFPNVARRDGETDGRSVGGWRH